MPDATYTGPAGSAFGDSAVNTEPVAGFGTYGYQTMMLSGVVAGLGDIWAGQAQSKALGIQAGFNRFQAGENVKRAGAMVSQLDEQTGALVSKAGENAKQTIGAQRAAYAAQGVNVNVGTPMQEQVAEGQMSTVDAMTLRNNAALKAWGIETQAIQTAGGLEFEAESEQAQGQQSVILGGAKAMNALLQQQEESQRSRMYAGQH